MRLFIAAFALFFTLPAMAQSKGITLFSLDSITSSNVSLSDRLGTTLSSTEHLVNRADCYRYIGVSEPAVCDSGSTTATGTTDDAGTTTGDDAGTTDNGSDDDAGTTDNGSDDDAGTTDNGSDDDAGTADNGSDDDAGTADNGSDDDAGTADNGSDDDAGTADNGRDDDAGTTDNGSDDDAGTTDGEPLCTAGNQTCENCFIKTCNEDGLSFDGGVECADATVQCTNLDCGDTCTCNQCAEGQVCNADSQCEDAGSSKPESRWPEEGDEGDTDSGEATDGSDGTDGTDGTGTPATSSINSLKMTVSMSSDYAGSEFRVTIGSACPTTDFPDTDSTSCITVYTDSSLDTVTQVEVTIKMADLLGSDCTDEGENSVWFYAKKNDIDPIAVSQVIFERDYTVPTNPTISAVDEGETNLKVSWDHSTSEAETTYTVYYAQQSFTSDDIAAGNIASKSGITVTNDYQLTGLENNVKYYVGVAAVDRYDNESPICDPDELGEGTPILVDDFFEYYKGQGGREEGGFCFVATAAWGSGIAPSVKQLQAFRDTQLMKSEGGRALVDLYYTVGPHAASKLAGNDSLRAVARGLLAPLVLVTGYPMLGLLLLSLMLFGGWLALRRKGVQS
jgi:hypothetical protein